MSMGRPRKTVHKITARGVAGDLAHVEERVDQILEIVEKLPTRDEMQSMLDRTFDLTKLKTEHDRMKKSSTGKVQY